MNELNLYRKRIFPDECIHLKDDIILHFDSSLLITQWNVLKPKKLLHHGYSCYYLEKGFKISKFLTEDNQFLYWYCDVFDYTMSQQDLIIRDLLTDIIVLPDSTVKVVDLDELGDCLLSGQITPKECARSLHITNELLSIIYSGSFQELCQPIVSLI